MGDISSSMLEHCTNHKLRKQKGYRFILGNFENNPEFAITASGSVFLARH